MKILIIFFLLVILFEFGFTYDKVKLSDVKTLTLSQGKKTTGRRSAPVQQLNCIGGSARKQSHEINRVQCYNMGVDDKGDVQWKCDADMSNNLKFGELEVTCEGYSYPDDPYILAGSCGLEYTLEYTSGSNSYSSDSDYRSQNYHHDDEYSPHYDSTPSGKSSLKSLFMFGILVFIMYNIFKQCTAANPSPSVGGSSGSGYGGGFDGGPGGGGGFGGGSPYPGAGCQPPPTTSFGMGYGSRPWRPGFWTGLFTGGFLGNMFNRPSSFTTTPRYSTARASSSRSSFSSSSFSSGSRMSSGFGGTRRR